MKTRNYYLIFGIVLFAVRLYLNFSTEMLLGINGAYNVVQVRSILQNGKLGFPDMPLYFYLNAGSVQCFSYFSSLELNQLIIIINKVVDSFCISTTAIPIYFIRKNYLNQSIPPSLEISILAFAMFFFAPLSLTGEFQKNAAAIPLLAGFSYFLLANLKTPNRKNIVLGSLLFLLTALTHFGVFSVALILLLTSIGVKYRQKSILPIAGISILSIGLIFLFDASRALRLLQSGLSLFRGIPRPELFLLFNLTLIYPTLWFVNQIRKDKEKITSLFTKQVVYTFGILLLMLTFPLMQPDYSKRLNLITFIPFSVLLFAISPYFSAAWQKRMTTVLTIIVVLSLGISLLRPKRSSISEAALKDLKIMKTTIDYTKNTLFVAKHGVEWWLAWELEAKVGQSQAVDLNSFQKYHAIYTVIEKTDNKRKMPPNAPKHFQNPYAPKDGLIIYESDYFKVVKLERDDLLELQKYATNQR